MASAAPTALKGGQGLPLVQVVGGGHGARGGGPWEPPLEVP